MIGTAHMVRRRNLQNEHSVVKNDRLAAFPYDDQTMAIAVANAVQMKIYFSRTAVGNTQRNATYAAKLARAEGR